MAKDEISDFVDFLGASPTAWHAVQWLQSRLDSLGYQELLETEKWNISPGGKYYVIRNGASICCFQVPKSTPRSACIFGAHTDSPGLKLKPFPEYHKEKAVMLGVEVYGGPLLSSWLNRDLGLAGRIIYRTASREIREDLVDLKEHPFTLPQLAIHLDREVNQKGLLLNRQDHLPILAALSQEEENEAYLEGLLKDKLPIERLLGMDLLFYPLEPPRRMGRDGELLASYRLDNLNGVHGGLRALTSLEDTPQDTIPMGVFWDHEEIGSGTAHGAGSPFLTDVLERIIIALGLSREDYLCLCSRSLLVSVDLAHATHPNYPDKHDPQHKLYLNQGVVLKLNAQQRYANDAKLTGMLNHVAEHHGIKLQTFVSRTDMPTGSTIGPISATRSGIPTIDLGCPELSMHSARELMGCQDHVDLCHLLGAVLRERCTPD